MKENTSKKTVKKSVTSVAKKSTSKKVVSKKVEKSPTEVAFEKFVSKNGLAKSISHIGKKKAFEIFNAGVKVGKTSK